jgi:serine/threonine-protein kinase RsbW
MVHFSLPSDLDSLMQVDAIIEQLNSEYQINDDINGRLMMALHEAITNAIIHGNKLDPKKTVEISAHSENGILNIKVTDQGKGFNPDALPDPLDESNLLKSGGRGVFLIRQFADIVTFNETGTEITISYNL